MLVLLAVGRNKEALLNGGSMSISAEVDDCSINIFLPRNMKTVYMLPLRRYTLLENEISIHQEDIRH